MFEELQKIDDICNILVYSRSAYFNKFLIDSLKEKLEVKWDTLLMVNNPAEFKEAKQESYNLPFSGGKWLIVYDVDNVKSYKELLFAMRSMSVSRCTLFLCKNYKTFTFLQEEAKKQGRFTKVFYGNKLLTGDMLYLYESIVSKDKRTLSQPLWRKFIKEYRFNVDAVFELFNYLNEGKTFETLGDIIKLVGLGKNSVNDILITLLKNKVKTQKGQKMLTKKLLFQFNDLSQSLSEDAIINFMISGLKGMVALKELQLMGKYTTVHGFLPIGDNFDITYASRLGFASKIVVEEIALSNIVKLLYICLDSKKRYPFLNAKSLYLTIIFHYLGDFYETRDVINS